MQNKLFDTCADVLDVLILGDLVKPAVLFAGRVRMKIACDLGWSGSGIVVDQRPGNRE